MSIIFLTKPQGVRMMLKPDKDWVICAIKDFNVHGLYAQEHESPKNMRLWAVFGGILKHVFSFLKGAKG